MQLFFSLLLACFAAAAALSPLQRPEQPARPHLILMVLDDVGWSDVGYHGSDFPTPHIDELAATGVKLGRFYGACKSRPIHPR